MFVFTVQPGAGDGQRRSVAHVEAKDITVEFDRLLQIHGFDVVVVQVMQAHFESPFRLRNVASSRLF